METEYRQEHIFEEIDGPLDVVEQDLLVVRFEDIMTHMPEITKDILDFMGVPKGIHSKVIRTLCDNQETSLSKSSHLSSTDLVCFRLVACLCRGRSCYGYADDYDTCAK